MAILYMPTLPIYAVVYQIFKFSTANRFSDVFLPI